MKAFVIPKIEVVHFGKVNIFAASCETCPGCPPGSYGCPCVDSWTSDYAPNDLTLDPSI